MMLMRGMKQVLCSVQCQEKESNEVGRGFHEVGYGKHFHFLD